MQFYNILEDIFQKNANLWLHLMVPPELYQIMQNISISTALHASFLLRGAFELEEMQGNFNYIL